MSNFEKTHTTNVINSFAQTPDKRLKQVMTSLIKHLHGFIKDVELTEVEWFMAIDFLTRTGQISDDKRQEFILLSDTTGVTMLVDAINHRKPGNATENTIFGPFYRQGAKEYPFGAAIPNHSGKGQTAVVMGRVLATNGTPIPNALLDVWETNDDGFYDSQLPEQTEFDLRGKFRTNAHGEFKFVCIRPVPYPIPYDGPVGQMLKATKRHPNRPAHIHVIVTADGFTPVTTHIFDKASKWLDSDAVFGTKDSLLVNFVKRNSKKEAAKHNVAAPYCEVNFDFVLNPVKKTRVKG